MANLVDDGLYLTLNQRRLLGGGRDILDDIRHLCTSLTALPDGCACGNGRSLLGGSCAWCHAVHRERIPDCADCETALARLRPKFDTLAVDTGRFFERARTEGFSIERHITVVVQTFDRLVVAVNEFQVGCRASHLQVVKDMATHLLADVCQLDEHLEGKR